MAGIGLRSASGRPRDLARLLGGADPGGRAARRQRLRQPRHHRHPRDAAEARRPGTVRQFGSRRHGGARAGPRHGGADRALQRRLRAAQRVYVRGGDRAALLGGSDPAGRGRKGAGRLCRPPGGGLPELVREPLGDADGRAAAHQLGEHLPGRRSRRRQSGDRDRYRHHRGPSQARCHAYGRSRGTPPRGSRAGAGGAGRSAGGDAGADGLRLPVAVPERRTRPAAGRPARVSGRARAAGRGHGHRGTRVPYRRRRARAGRPQRSGLRSRRHRG